MTASDKDTVDLDMNALDALFAQATNDVGAQPSEAFMTRVVTDALAQPPRPQIVQPSLWAQITAMVGGGKVWADWSLRPALVFGLGSIHQRVCQHNLKRF